MNGWRAGVLVVCVWAVVFLPGLGGAGLTDTEGHRAVPAFAMLADGAEARAWLFTPELFDRVYLRKPPGMAWLVGISSGVFGTSEFSARLVSAVSVLLAACACGWFARRWFGVATFLPASLAVVLMPVLWIHGRAAELEAPLFAATLVASLAVVDLVVRRSGAVWLLAVAGMLGSLMLKGPAGLPAIVGAAAGAAIAHGSLRVLLSPRLFAAVLVPVAVFGAWALASAWFMRDAPAPVLQSPGAFLWSTGRLFEIAALPVLALLAGLPVTLSLLFPWGPDARDEPLGEDEAVRRLSRTLAWATLITLGIFLISGVSNPRYALPALVFAPALVGWVVGGMDLMAPKRTRIAAWMLLGGPRAAVIGAMAAALVFIQLVAPRVRSESGRDAGEAMARLVPSGSIVLADHAVEARPEVLWELEASGADVRWQPLEAPDPAAFLVLREDEGSAEASRLAAGRERLGEWRVHEFSFVLLAPAR